MVNIVNIINKIFVNNLPKSTGASKKQLFDDVETSLSQYRSTISYLEKYDDGKISNPKVLAKHRNLRSYIQSI